MKKTPTIAVAIILQALLLLYALGCSVKAVTSEKGDVRTAPHIKKGIRSDDSLIQEAINLENVAFTYLEKGNDNLAIENAQKALEAKGLPEDVKHRLFLLISDASLRKGDFAKGVEYLIYAYSLTIEEKEKEEILDKVTDISARLTGEEIDNVTGKTGYVYPAGFLVLQKARLYEQQGLLENAIETIMVFMMEFPGHELSEEAKALAARLSETLEVDRNAIGCLLPLSGTYGKSGNEVLSGIEAALLEHNSRPDVLPIRIVIKDSKGDKNAADQALRELVGPDRVIGVIGPMITAEHVAETAQALEVPIITLTQKENITKAGNYVFRCFLTPTQQVEKLLSYAIDEKGITRFSILYPNDQYGLKFMTLFKEAVVSKGAEVNVVESYESGQTDFTGQIKRLKELSIGSQALFIPDGPDKIALIAPYFRYNNISGLLLMGTNLWYSPQLLKQAAWDMQGAVFPVSFFSEDTDEQTHSFVGRFKGMFGKEPGFLEAQGYDAANLFFHLLDSSPVSSRSALRDALRGVATVPTVTGFLSFDETNDAVKDLSLLKIVEKKFVKVGKE
ncbi:MAG: penicillin-binding protein activator [Pseudomonadota bacterium]